MSSPEVTGARAGDRVGRFFGLSQRGLVLDQAFSLRKEGTLNTFILPDSGPIRTPRRRSGKLSHLVKLHGACSMEFMWIAALHED